MAVVWRVQDDKCVKKEHCCGEHYDCSDKGHCYHCNYDSHTCEKKANCCTHHHQCNDGVVRLTASVPVL